jgi:hypothetical protein
MRLGTFALSGVVLGIMFIALAVQASAQTAATSLDLVLSSQSPYPVEPGSVVNVEVMLQNSGLKDAENVVLTIEPNDPFTLLAGEAVTKKFNVVGASNNVKATYKLQVSNKAVSNDYDLTFRYYTGGDTGVTVLKEIPINVRGNPKLILRKMETVPKEVEPGEAFDVKATIENVGTGNAYYMQSTLNSTTTYIVPVLSGGMFYIGELHPGESKEATFRLTVDSAAEYKTYSGALTISYMDDTNAIDSAQFSLGIPITGVPEIEILSTSMDNSNFKVDIENIGSGSAKAVKTMLMQDGEIKDVSVTNELEPSKHKTLSFSGFSYGQGLINISYLDQINNPHNVVMPVSIKKAASQEQNSGNSSAIFVPVLVIAVVLETFYIWRIRKKVAKK